MGKEDQQFELALPSRNPEYHLLGRSPFQPGKDFTSNDDFEGKDRAKTAPTSESSTKLISQEESSMTFGVSTDSAALGEHRIRS